VSKGISKTLLKRLKKVLPEVIDNLIGKEKLITEYVNSK